MPVLKCHHCSKEVSFKYNIEYVEYSCAACGHTSCAYQSTTIDNSFITINPSKLSFELGEFIRVENIEYQLISIAVKRVKTYTKWIEYTFVGEKNKRLYLSECNGHWIKLLDTNKPKVFRYSSKTALKDSIFIKHKTYKIYSKDYVDVIYADGVFDYKNSTKRYELAEYIHPPFILSVEFRNRDYHAVHGEHISREELQAIKPNIYLPLQLGTGIVEPYKWDVFRHASIYVYSAFIIILLFTLSYVKSQNRKVFNVYFSLNDANPKEVRSESFELKGWASAPLTFDVLSNNDNSWTSTTIELVNEKTNESVYATQDVEYYSGVDGGERWSEGSNSNEFSICGVGAGKYHLLISSQKDMADIFDRSVSVNVSWDRPSFWNAGMALLALACIAGINYYMTRNHDVNRWSESDYDIYYIEE